MEATVIDPERQRAAGTTLIGTLAANEDLETELLLINRREASNSVEVSTSTSNPSC